MQMSTTARSYANVYAISQTKKRKKKSKAKKCLLIALAVLAVLILLTVLIICSVSPKIVDICRSQINAHTKLSLNSAVRDVMSEPVRYSDIVKIEKDNAGAVTNIEFNAILVNQLAVATVQAAEQKLLSTGEYEIKIPVGQLTGIKSLASRGVKINVNVQPYTAVYCNFISEFEEAGINQTRHKLYITVMSVTDVILPAYTGSINTEIQVLVAENIIVGKVPEVYLNLKTLGGNQLDLTP